MAEEKDVLDRNVRPVLGRMRIDDISKADVRKLLNEMLVVQAAVRLPVDGGGDPVHLLRLLRGLAPPFFTMGGRERQRR